MQELIKNVLAAAAGGVMVVVVRAFYEGVRDAIALHKKEAESADTKYFWPVLKNMDNGRIIRSSGDFYDTRMEAWKNLMNLIFFDDWGTTGDKVDIFHGTRNDLIREIAKPWPQEKGATND